MSKRLPNPVKDTRTVEILEKVKKCEMPGTGFLTHKYMSKWPFVIAQGRGATLKDVAGNKYIDLHGAFGSASTGYSHPKVVDAIKDQVTNLMFCGGRFLYPSRGDLEEKILSLAPGANKKIHIGTSGTDAIESAIKLVHHYKKRPQIIAFQGGFHGRFHGAIALTSGRVGKTGIYPWMPGVIHVPYPYCYRCKFGKYYPECGMECTTYLESVLDDPCSGASEVAAIFVEPMQGFYGFAIVPPREFMPELRRICDDYDILLVVDEVYTGFGRTGKWFACEHSSVTPDIMTCGKGAASGLPFSAVIAKSSIADECTEVATSATFLANPLSCAAAMATIAVMEEEKLVENSAKNGQYLLHGLRDLFEDSKFSGEVRGKGLFMAAEFVEDEESKKPATEIVERITFEALTRGLFVEPGGRFNNCLRISPPLLITKEEIDKALDILKIAIHLHAQL